MNQRLLMMVWILVAFAMVLAVAMVWQRMHPPRSHDQRILIEKAK